MQRLPTGPPADILGLEKFSEWGNIDVPTGENSVSSSGRLFWISCIALTAVSFNFAAIGAAMFAFRQEFGLTNAEAGWIGGAGIWGIAVAQLVFNDSVIPRPAAAAP